MKTKLLSIGSCLSNSWNTIFARPGLWVVFTLLALGLSLPGLFAFGLAGFSSHHLGNLQLEVQAQLDAQGDVRPILEAFWAQVNPIWLGLAAVLSLLSSVLAQVGWASVSIRSAFNEPLEWRDFFRPMACVSTVITFLVATILYAGLIGLGIVLLIVPVLVLWPKFALWPYLAIRLRLGPIDALRAASQTSMNAKPKLLVLLLALTAIGGALGVIPVAGAFFGALWTQVALAHASKGLLEQTTLTPDLSHPIV
jgi:hypothetical protein